MEDTIRLKIMARMSVEYLRNMVASNGYVYVSGIRMYCRVVLLGSTKYSKMLVQIYPKMDGYTYSYVNDYGAQWNKFGASIACECNTIAIVRQDVSFVIQTLIEKTQLRIFIESVKY